MTAGTREAIVSAPRSLDAGTPATERGAQSYDTTILATPDAVIDRIRALEAARLSNARQATVFQSAPWLDAIRRSQSRIGDAPMFAIEISDRASGALVALLPLTVAREGRLRVARFADIGVSDYRAAILGPMAPHDSAGRSALWRAIVQALAGRADLIRFEAMPQSIAEKPNPLAALPDARRSRLTGMSVGIETTVEDFLRGRGKKYRKEAERCFRLLEKEGVPLFRRADTPDAIERAYAALEAQQSRRHGDAGSETYVLDQPKFSEFYRDLLHAEMASGFARIFTLECDGRIVAVLMGVARGGTFTALRISNGGPDWRHLSPGRLVVIETMRHLVASGIRTFDLGAGDYPFKRGLGAEETPLFDLVAPVTIRGRPAAAADRLKAWLKQHPALADATKRLLRRG